ncbi:hypothetical protein B0H15DRAFT_832404 [Mycena belliarum]|uniref:Uncharacterized protein n=1 Tax=Mycena belliarum TaxID=1033014 RepID=A0AAD6UA48_9AGAR|nr:hypothetical protein B0H15DRAFT_832404 [Mycena belliae]
MSHNIITPAMLPQTDRPSTRQRKLDIQDLTPQRPRAPQRPLRGSSTRTRNVNACRDPESMPLHMTLTFSRLPNPSSTHFRCQQCSVSLCDPTRKSSARAGPQRTNLPRQRSAAASSRNPLGKPLARRRLQLLLAPLRGPASPPPPRLRSSTGWRCYPLNIEVSEPAQAKAKSTHGTQRTSVLVPFCFFRAASSSLPPNAPATTQTRRRSSHDANPTCSRALVGDGAWSVCCSLRVRVLCDCTYATTRLPRSSGLCIYALGSGCAPPNRSTAQPPTIPGSEPGRGRPTVPSDSESDLLFTGALKSLFFAAASLPPSLPPPPRPRIASDPISNIT